MSTMPAQPAPSGKPSVTDPAKRIMPAKPKIAALVAVSFVALMYLAELVDVILPADLDFEGIAPRDAAGLDGIIWAPMLHGGWPHLLGNTVPVLIFAFLAMAGGVGQWIAVTATIWILGGAGVWLTGDAGSSHIGASGLAFGWLAYLLVRGLFNRSLGQLAVAVVLLVFWGGMLWGVLPGDEGISWQGHLFGALAGVLAAWVVARADRKRVAKPSGPVSPPGSLAA